MSEPWQIRIYDQHKLVYTANLTGPAELGRQSQEEEALYSTSSISGRHRIVVAERDEKSVSRQQVLVEPQTDGGFRVTNLSAERPISLADGIPLKPRASCSVSAAALLTLGKKTIRLQRATLPEMTLQGLTEVTLPPGHSPAPATPLSGTFLSGAAGVEMKALLHWLQAAVDVLQSAASTVDFFDKAAQAVVDLVHLDAGRVLLLRQGQWQTEAVALSPRVASGAARPASGHILSRVCEEKRTFWEAPAPSAAEVSLRDVDAVVAAPILNRRGVVIGALYGDRCARDQAPLPGPLTELEALLVEVFARGVAAGLARLEQEQAALAAQVQFEQFFTPELARQLARQPDLLKGRDAEVSLLFSDIRGFSRVSERLGPTRTVEWLGDVMGELSDCVRAHQGVLVDYIGDELLAMWGAPEEQADHAQLACRAALAMLERLPRLNARWQSVLGEPLELGIGIHTGLARVGNTGSHHKFKYGPLGHTVNLASRVQGATRYLRCRLLITGSTRALLGEEFALRRLCRVRVVNIAEPVMLYELVPAGRAGWPEARVEYEKALEEFEAGHFSTAARILGNWREWQANDATAVLLLYRAVRCLVEDPSPFDPAWVLPGK